MPPRASRWSRLWLLVAVVSAAAPALATSLGRTFGQAAWHLDGDAASDIIVWETTSKPQAPTLPTHDDQHTSQPQDLHAWAAAQEIQSEPPPAHRARADCFLVVGVKTRGVRGFHARQTIRATWGSVAATLDKPTRVVFLACGPDESQECDMNATERALALEKQAFGDLLTHELGGCVDGYDRLVDKVLGFFHWSWTTYPTAAFVMVADDDVYVRLDRVTEMLAQSETPRTRYYAGQVLAYQLRRTVRAMRDRMSKYYISESQFALSVYHPFAIGAHYLLSSDLVAFLARNRHDLRSIGAIEDVTIGFWLLSLLQVRVVDIPLFRCTTHSLCRNAFGSYGELSSAAVKQIHLNIQRGEAFCHGFSFSLWSTPGIQEPLSPHRPPRSDVSYTWELRVCPHTRTLRISTAVHLREPLTPLSLPDVVFSPSHETIAQFCTKVDNVAAQVHRRLPIMLCDDFVARLHAFLLSHTLSKTALLSLAISNLPPIAVSSASVTVWITRRVRRWRAFIESLVAEIYPDVRVFVVDDITAPDTTVLLNLELAVMSADEYPHLTKLPSTCRRLVTGSSHRLGDRPLLAQDVDHGNIQLMLYQTTEGIPQDLDTRESLYVPLVSMVFSDSVTHSPVALIQPSSTRTASFHPTKTFATSHCNSRVMALLAHLGEAYHVDCDREVSGMDPNGGGESSPETLFAFDKDVSRYTRSHFVLAFDTKQAVPGYIAGTIAAAFLAGSIPVYDGDEATVSRLFNPKAFIRCGQFRSLSDCGDHVMEVLRSPTSYTQMRNEAPVVNETAFFELFSWHPDVLREFRSKSVQQESLAERLRTIINQT